MYTTWVQEYGCIGATHVHVWGGGVCVLVVSGDMVLTCIEVCLCILIISISCAIRGGDVGISVSVLECILISKM